MIEAIVLGAVQGIAEWLPISSEGATVLTQIHFFGATDLSLAVSMSLFLHLGTLCAAIVYFRNDVVEIIRNLFSWKTVNEEGRAFITFLVIVTIISGILGLALLFSLEYAEDVLTLTGTGLTLLIAIALLITSFLLWTHKAGVEKRNEGDLSFLDSFLVGVGQGLSVIPGLSRSGTTISILLLRKVGEKEALRASFIASIPLVAAGALYLALDGVIIGVEALVGLLVAFVVGLGTINILMRVAERINFAGFVFVFSLLTFLSLFI